MIVVSDCVLREEVKLHVRELVKDPLCEVLSANEESDSPLRSDNNSPLALVVT